MRVLWSQWIAAIYATSLTQSCFRWLIFRQWKSSKILKTKLTWRGSFFQWIYFRKLACLHRSTHIPYLVSPVNIFFCRFWIGVFIQAVCLVHINNVNAYGDTTEHNEINSVCEMETYRLQFINILWDLFHLSVFVVFKFCAQRTDINFNEQNVFFLKRWTKVAMNGILV